MKGKISLKGGDIMDVITKIKEVVYKEYRYYFTAPSTTEVQQICR